MPQTYYARLTPLGEGKFAESLALGLRHRITHMAVGDGGGAPVMPDEILTGLKGERHRAPLNSLFQDPNNPHIIIAELILPATLGGWWIRELGLYDEDDCLLAVANSPETYKPLLSEGAGRDQVIRMMLVVASVDAIELKLDPSIVLATKESVDKAIEAHRNEAAPHTALTAHLTDPDAHPELDARYAPLSHLTDPNAHEDIRSEISTLSAGFRARGVVINALTAQAASYQIDRLQIAAPGTGYQVSDALILPSPQLDAIVIVAAVDEAGGVTQLAISKGGHFETDPSGSGFALFGGSGTGVTVNVAASATPSTTLADIVNPRQNDTAVVLHDEIHGGAAYDWGFFDYNGDGIANWVPVCPHSAADQNPVGTVTPEDFDRAFVGAIVDFGGNAAPTNAWVPLNGTLLSRAERPLLYNYANTTGNLVTDSVWTGSEAQRGHFSSGNGTTTFRAPDLRGEFRRGADLGRGVDSGRGIGSFQGDAIRNITGFVSCSGAFFDGATGAFRSVGSNGGISQVEFAYKSDDFDFDASRVVPTANENRSRNVAYPAFIYAGAPA